ncbi:MAG: hypothetical protein IJV83_03580 [Clostridia bacterium]|nr:hypothetical protein [Clostridia bacterium]
MELVCENQKTRISNAEIEAQKHNAQIKERYNKLLSAEADQFASETYAQAPVQEVRASVIAPEAPVYTSSVDAPVLEQAPQVTEFVREQVTASVFTAEKFERLQDFQAEIAPTYVAPVLQTASAAAVEEEQYSLSSFAKKIIAGVGAAIVVMTALIGVNSGIIRGQKVKLRNLQQRQQELVNENEEIQRNIQIATSEETIRSWAESQIQGN